MSDYDFTGAFVALAVAGAIFGALIVGLVWFMVSVL